MAVRPVGADDHRQRPPGPADGVRRRPGRVANVASSARGAGQASRGRRDSRDRPRRRHRGRLARRTPEAGAEGRPGEVFDRRGAVVPAGTGRTARRRSRHGTDGPWRGHGARTAGAADRRTCRERTERQGVRARLRLAPRTVGAHLCRVFAGLGIPSRASPRDAPAANSAEAGRVGRDARTRAPQPPAESRRRPPGLERYPDRGRSPVVGHGRGTGGRSRPPRGGRPGHPGPRHLAHLTAPSPPRSHLHAGTHTHTRRPSNQAPQQRS